MLVFLDTEFTDFTQVDLISVGMVADDGREFYAERTDYRRDDCNDWVVSNILPLLRKVPGAPCDQPEFTQRLWAWFDALPEPATLVFDSGRDWELLVQMLLRDGHNALPANVGEKGYLGDISRRYGFSDDAIETNEAFQTGSEQTYTDEWPPHHALADARALRAGFLAWRAEMEGCSRTTPSPNMG